MSGVSPITALTYGSYQYLMREVAMELGWNNNDGLLDHEQEYECNVIVQRGIKRFYNPPVMGKTQHHWSFLRPLSTLTTTASYNTGTIAIASGVVTLTGGTWPAEAADGEIGVSGNLYAVNTRDSDTQVTLDDLTIDVTAGAEYTLGFYLYDLPTDFVDVFGPITYEPSTTTWHGEIQHVAEIDIRKRRQTIDYFGYPTIYAIRPKALSQTTGTRYEIMLWPIPEDAWNLKYRYEAVPGDLTTSNLMPYGGDSHAPTWTEAVLAEAESSRWGNRSGFHEERFRERLMASISHDQQVNSPQTLGYNGDRSDVPLGGDHLYWAHQNSWNVVTYDGRTW